MKQNMKNYNLAEKHKNIINVMFISEMNTIRH